MTCRRQNLPPAESAGERQLEIHAYTHLTENENMNLLKLIHSVLIAWVASWMLMVVPAHSLESVIESQVESDESSVESQKKIDGLAAQASEDAQRIRLAEQRLESLTIYNDQLSRLIDSQESEITSLQRQTEEIDDIETGALPLMIEMTDTIKEMVSSDLPFLLREREDRADNLSLLIDRADVTAGEKFRRIMEAYLVELDFGRTIEAYRGELDLNNAVKTVNFLRVGRLGLYYQTLDGSESGWWNADRGVFQSLGSDSRDEIRAGLRIARKQAPPELLLLPIGTPKGALK